MGDSPDDSPSDDAAALAVHAAALADAVEAALGPWLVHQVVTRAPGLRAEADDAAAGAVAATMPALRALLETDIDHQRATPLQLLRDAARAATAVLQAGGVEPAPRDRMAVRIDPDDPYDLGPLRFADLGEAVGEAGIVWGAAKAHVHKARHRPA